MSSPASQAIEMENESARERAQTAAAEDVARPVSGEVAVAPRGVEPGEVLGRYRVSEVLGEGAQGTVYRGEHLMLGYPVAIKVLNDQMAGSKNARERLYREARLGAAIRHRNLVGVLEAGETLRGVPYLVMELVEGLPLDRLVQRRCLPPAAAIELGTQLCAALTTLDAEGIRHRDIKPDNVVLERTVDGEVIARLLDFGISKSTTGEHHARTLTQQGSVLGTPQYMAPEQVRGEKLDVRADLYGLCALLFEAISGEPPHDGPNLTAVLASVSARPAPPLRTLAPACPRPLADIIDKGLRRDREDRWAHPATMAESLRAVGRRLGLERGADAWRGLLEDPETPVGTAAIALRRQKTAPSSARSAWTAAVTRWRRPALGAAAAAALAGLVALGMAPNGTEAAAPAQAKAAPAKPAEAEGLDDADVAAPDLDALERSARGLFVRGEAESALSLYQQVVDRAPERASGWRGLGLVAAALERPHLARRALRRYLALDPSAPDRDSVERELSRL